MCRPGVTLSYLHTAAVEILAEGLKSKCVLCVCVCVMCLCIPPPPPPLAVPVLTGDLAVQRGLCAKYYQNICPQLDIVCVLYGVATMPYSLPYLATLSLSLLSPDIGVLSDRLSGMQLHQVGVAS